MARSMGPVDESKQMFTLDCYLRQVQHFVEKLIFRICCQYWTDSRLIFNSKHITELTLNWQVWEATIIILIIIIMIVIILIVTIFIISFSLGSGDLILFSWTGRTPTFTTLLCLTGDGDYIWWWYDDGDGDNMMMVLWWYDGSRFIRVGHNGRVSYSQRLTVTARCRMDLSKFPHDSQVTKSKGRGSNLFDPICLQICPLKISSFGHDKSQVTLRAPQIFHGKEHVFFCFRCLF